MGGVIFDIRVLNYSVFTMQMKSLGGKFHVQGGVSVNKDVTGEVLDTT